MPRPFPALLTLITTTLIAAIAILGPPLSVATMRPQQVPSASTPGAYLPIIQRAPNTPTPSATPTQALPSPTSTPTLPPPTYNACQADPNPSAAPNYPVRIVDIDKSAETVTLRNVTTADTIDLTGWQMCSITGNQHHPIGGTLAPGETRTFQNNGGPIWNNSLSDPGALYNPAGQLVSYHFD